MTSQQDLYVVADFSIMPVGTGPTPSIAEHVAECVRVLEKNKITYKLHGYGTNIEGPWSQVMKVIQDCHHALHAKGVPRIATDVRITTQVDKQVKPGSANEDRVKRVEEILGKK